MLQDSSDDEGDGEDQEVEPEALTPQVVQDLNSQNSLDTPNTRVIFVRSSDTQVDTDKYSQMSNPFSPGGSSDLESSDRAKSKSTYQLYKSDSDSGSVPDKNPPIRSSIAKSMMHLSGSKVDERTSSGGSGQRPGSKASTISSAKSEPHLAHRKPKRSDSLSSSEDIYFSDNSMESSRDIQKGNVVYYNAEMRLHSRQDIIHFDAQLVGSGL